MFDEKVQKLIDLVILRDEHDRIFDDMSTESMSKLMPEYRKIEQEMVKLARELDSNK